ncbi:MAG: aldo/keto reductase [Janthinobacterium lividum]
MERRDFIKGTALAAAAAAVGTDAARAAPTEAAGQQALEARERAAAAQGGAGDPVLRALMDQAQGGVLPAAPGLVTASIAQAPDMKYRTLGHTGERMSLVGLGGFHLAKPGGPTSEEAVRLVHAGIEAGVNFCDNCWDYNGGESEIRLGRALSQGGYRNRTFLMTKIDGRTAKAATAQLDESLRRLKTDHLDLLQFHEIIRMGDPERVFADGGALEAVLRAREQGKLRYIGFTGHKSPAIHRHMFDVADQHGFRFDTVQMPLNVMDAHFDSFEQGVLPMALSHGTAVLGMKTFGDNFILKSGVASPAEMLHYPMSLPVSIQVCGIDNAMVLQQALDAVRSFVPPTDAERVALLSRTAVAAKDGATERYKVSNHFDGTAQNPQWLG